MTGNVYAAPAPASRSTFTSSPHAHLARHSGTLARANETALDSLLASGREERAYVATLGLPEARDEYETVVGLPPSAGALEVATRLRMAARRAITEERAKTTKKRA